MTTATNIATKLNVLESAIVRVDEWVNVLFVVVKGLGGRFVSKKMKVTEENKMELPVLTGTAKQIEWAEKIRFDFVATSVEFTAWVNRCPGSTVREVNKNTIGKIMIREILSDESASFWIDNRSQLAVSHYQSLRSPALLNAIFDSAFIEEIKAEASTVSGYSK